MWQRFSLYDARIIAHYLGVIILIAGVFQLLPLATAIAFGEWHAAERYLLSIGISLILGYALRLIIVSPHALTRQQAIAITGVSWITLGILGAIPLAASGHYHYFVDALFDCVSAYSATGVSIISGLDHLSNADNMWRFSMHFLGGVGVIVIALSIGAVGLSSTDSLFQSEARSEHIVPNILETARFILRFSLAIIAVATITLSAVLVMMGMAPERSILHGLWLSVSGFMTAGFSPMAESVLYYHSFIVELVLIVVMLAGGINFIIHEQALRGRTRLFFKDIEVRAAVMWWVVLLVPLIIVFKQSELMDGISTLMRTVVFNFISAATTTGFTTITTNQIISVIPSGAALILVMAMAIGASAGSTSGGIKLMRIGIIAKSALESMRATISSDSAIVVETYNHIGTKRLTSDVVKEAMTVCILFLVTYIIGGLIGIALGYDAIDAIFESVAMASNSGITAGISSSGMPLVLKITYILQMWAGRLEFITLLALGAKLAASLIRGVRGH